MREINLNGKFYEVKDEIIKRAVSPWIAKVSSGGTEYSDFSTAELEEYFDFRNGIGKNRAVGSEARTQFTEGIDFTTEGQAVLSPLVTTAGSFGVAPVRIIDFENVTYAIGDNAIRRWNTTTSVWDYADPYLIHDCEAAWDELVDGDATVTLDTTVEKQGSGCAKMVVGAGLANGDIIATDDITTITLANSEKIVLWIQSTEDRASGDLQLLLDDSAQCASPLETINIPALTANTWTQCTLTLANPETDIAIISVGLKFTTNAEASTIYLDHIRGTFPDVVDTIVATDPTDSYLFVTSTSTGVYTADGITWNSTHGSYLDSTEIDASGKLTVTATKATGADVDADEDVYLYSDHGANIINSINLDFELLINATSDNNGIGGIAVASAVGAINDFGATDITVTIEKTAGGAYQIAQKKGAASGADDSYSCSADTLYYCTLARTAGSDTVTVGIYSDSGRTTLLDTLSVAGYGATTTYRYVYNFVNYNSATGGENWDGYTQNLFHNAPRGLMAFYASKLWSIDTDGLRLRSSPSKDVDGHGSHFELSGDFGTVYGLFEGKLLADGTPALYFHGTKGLYTVDTTNEIAYKQEINFPPLTYAGHAGMYWNGSVWVATGFGILKVTPSLATEVGPNQDDGLPVTYQGSIFDMTTVNNWLVYCVNGGNLAEGFTAFTETDPNSRIAVTSTKVTWTDLTRNEDAYVYLDKTAGYFDGDFTHFSTVSLTAGATNGFVFCWALANIVDDIKGIDDASGDYLGIYLKVGSASSRRIGLEECDGGTLYGAAEGAFEIEFGTTYYLNVVRDESVGTYGTLYLYTYSDFDRTTLVDTQTITLHSSKKDFRYVYACASYNSATGEASTAYTEDLQLVGTTPDKSSILKRNSSYGGNLQVYTSAANQAIAAIHHSPSSLYTNGRLWFGEGTSVKYMMFPDTTSNVKQIATYQYVDDSGYAYLPVFRKLANITKVALGVSAITKSADANEYIEVWYQLNGTGSWTDMGDFNTSPRDDILTFGSGLGTEFYTIQFRIKLLRGSTNTNSPELESLLFYYLNRPETTNAWTFNVLATDEDAEKTIAEFEALRDTKTLMPFYDTGDPSKTVYNVAVSALPMRYYVENQGTPKGVIQVTVQEVFSG